ncbi:MAG: hypothetical protein D6727_09365 [Gammaproteobacteria bacterium]|nr:MAG: hypothetical protein D6727_09365 [Gammaproteobacteria bacterium]
MRDVELDDELDEDPELAENEDGEESSSDNVGETSVEINVDELIAEMEAEGIRTDHLHGNYARRRLEELMEQRRLARELGDFDDLDFED